MDTMKDVIDSSTRDKIFHNLIKKLRAYYVYPEIAEEICIELQMHIDEGEYDDITDGEFLAFALTTHIQEVSKDKHLWVRWHPDSLPDHEGPMYVSQEWQDESRQQAKLDNYGFHKVERLPGNVGYIDIWEFYKASWGGSSAVAAMTLLTNTSALIIDLRNCRGGDPEMVALISSYLFGEDPVHLNSLYWREDDVTQQYWTLSFVPGERFVDKPVYVLTSKDTFSGGEEFAYNLKALQRATLIGEVTGGGAHPGSSYRLSTHFEVFIPNGRAINPITGTNWEGVGVTPDIQISQKQALKVAYRMALGSIIESLNDGLSRPLSQLKEEAVIALKELENS
jgi:hypothetical protein